MLSSSPVPFSHQLDGAVFLASRKAAMLADDPRVGKTGSAIRACDYVMAKNILVITKSSARAQWGRELHEWGFPRDIQVVYEGKAVIRDKAEAVVVGWGMVFSPGIFEQLTARRWDVLILDESHEAKNPESRRSQAVYSRPDALCRRAVYTWPMSGTPVPNAPIDLHPMLLALAPERLAVNAERGWPDVIEHKAFLHRYCVTKKKYVGGKWIEYAIKGRNETELKERLRGFWLRRTQSDVGIGEPIYSILALHPGDFLTADIKRQLADIEPYVNDILLAAETDTTTALQQHLGPIRRITGTLQAHALIEHITEQLNDGLDKIVVMAWHTEVIDILRKGLSAFGVVGIDGRTPPHKRDNEVAQFKVGSARVFVGQILAAGEAIDLSVASVLIFAESSLVPKDMKQAALRITNHAQKRQALVQVCALAGSIYEALHSILLRKVKSITMITGA